MVHSYPFEVEEVNKEITKNENKSNSLILVGPKKICLRKSYKDEVLPKLYNFEIRKDDVWLFGFPRSGTTLAQEIVWLIGNDLNYEKAAQDIMDVRFPVFELSGYMNVEELAKNRQNYEEILCGIVKKWAKPAWEILAEREGRRFIKTHIPLSLANPDIMKSGCKIVYVARNPKDVCVSLYNLERAFDKSGGNKKFETFFQEFRSDVRGSYFINVKEGWQMRNHENVLFLFYEEYTKDLRKTIKRVADFFDKSLSEADVRKLEDHLKIENFRKNKSVNNDHLRDLNVMEDKNDLFIRKGKVGGWRDYFSGKLDAEADKWIADNLKDTDLKFPVA